MKLRIGDKVKLNKNVKKFTHGKGLVGYDEIGTIIKFNKYGYKEICVDFPSCCDWLGLEEVVLVDRKKFFKKLPNNFTGTIEVENGYIVEKEILDEEEREYLTNVIKPFKNRVKCISKENTYIRNYYILIDLDNDDIALPIFSNKTMYKGMEEEKKYTLEELGL